MASPTVEELRDKTRFELILLLRHDQVAQFARQFFWQQKSWITVVHLLFCLGLTGALVLTGCEDQISIAFLLGNISIAVLFTLGILLPLHELIHGVVYKAGGARDVRYKLEWRQLYAFAIAHNFVAGRRFFSLVAIAPFVLISAALMLACVLIVPCQFFFLAALLIHTVGTCGDFAMLNYQWFNRRDEVYTIDDAEEKESYFFKRIGQMK